MADQPHVTVLGLGVHCDHCGWEQAVEKIDRSWVDKPCPKCGANLMTEEDYLKSEFMMTAIEAINKMELPPELAQGERFITRLSNGEIDLKNLKRIQ